MNDIWRESRRVADAPDGVITSGRKRAGKEHEPLRAEILHGDPLLPGKLVRGRNSGDKRLVHNPFEREMRSFRNGRMDEPEINAVAAECLGLLRARHLIARQAHARIALQEAQYDF